MINNENRFARLTSSQMFRVVGTPAVLKTYLKEKEAEVRLNRSIDLGSYSQEMTWGKICEAYLFSQEKYFPTGCGYSLCSKKTVVHDVIKIWAGSPDVEGKDDAGEIKCFYPKNYFHLSSALLSLKSGDMLLKDFKKEYKEVYWQVLSNTILLNKSKCTIFTYIPTLQELEDLILIIEETSFCEKIGLEPWMYRFITEAAEKEKLYKLPYIDPEKTDFPNFVKYTFDPPEEDIVFLTQRVIEAGETLFS